MTISSATRKAGPFLGNGVTNSFPFTFKVFDATNLQVIKTSVAGSDLPALVLNSDYSVALNADQNNNPGGSVTYPLSGSLLQTGEKLTVTGVLPSLQGTKITNGGNFFANNIEDQMDYLTILVQQHDEKLSRSLIGSPSDQAPNLSLGTAAQRANRYVAFDSLGNMSLSASLPSGTLSQASILSFLSIDLNLSQTSFATILGADPIARRTTGEIAAGITPVNLGFAPTSPTPNDAGRYNSAAQLRTAADLLAVFGNPRTKPAAFGYVTGNVYDCAGPGLASHDFDAEQEFLTTYGALGGPTFTGQYWVDPANGSDLNAGGFNDPFKTVAACLQNAVGLGVIWLLPGDYTDRLDVRATYNLVSGGTQARAVRIKAWAGPGSVTFRAAGQQPGEMVWALTAGTTFEYEATPVGGEIALLAIYREDNREVPIQWYSSAANVNAQSSGWYQDPATKKIYIRHENFDLSLPGNADRFELIYTPTLGNIILGGKVYLEGITFRGGGALQIQYQTNGGNNYRPVCYARYCKWQYLSNSNVEVIGGLTVFQDCISERSLGDDGFNYTDDLTQGQKCEAIEIDCIGRNNGVKEYSLFDGQRNKQGSSGHLTTSILRVNGQYYGNYGQNIADTGVNSTTWMIGTICGSPYADLAPSGIGGYYDLWLEGSCYVDNVRAGSRAATYGLWLETGTARLYRCQFRGSTAPIGVNVGVTGIFNPIA